MLAPLKHKNFALLWTGGLISMIGNWMLMAALPFYIYALDGYGRARYHIRLDSGNLCRPLGSEKDHGDRQCPAGDDHSRYVVGPLDRMALDHIFVYLFGSGIEEFLQPR